MHPNYTELSRTLSQACRALVEQYGAPDTVRSPHSQVQVASERFWIRGPQLQLQSINGSQWQARSSDDVAGWTPATIDDLQEGERILSELTVLAANGAWLKKADGSIRRLKAILKALEVA